MGILKRLMLVGVIFFIPLLVSCEKEKEESGLEIKGKSPNYYAIIENNIRDWDNKSEKEKTYIVDMIITQCVAKEKKGKAEHIDTYLEKPYHIYVDCESTEGDKLFQWDGEEKELYVFSISKKKEVKGYCPDLSYRTKLN